MKNYTTDAGNNTENWKLLIDFAHAHACNWSMEPDSSGDQWGIHQFDDPPHNRLLGPAFARGGASGLVQHKGKQLVAWGDIDRADMTFSVTKTYLALTAGIAFDRGLLPDLDLPVQQRLPGIGFDEGANRQVSWRQLLHFTSEWHGQCFGVPDQVDHYRVVGMQPNKTSARKGDARPMKIPGSYWEYNDVRINQFSLALLHLFEKPLPEVFREHIMQPLGASDNWTWHGYENSWVNIKGQILQSVPGGGHWGGGMVISARDQARVAQLMLDRGHHKGQQLVSAEWLSLMLTPCPIAPFYGFFTWLNTGHAISQLASANSYFAMGIGGQLLWHDPDRELLLILRWADSEQLEGYIRLVLKVVYPGVA